MTNSTDRLRECVTKGGGGPKIAKICVTSFMDGPIRREGDVSLSFGISQKRRQTYIPEAAACSYPIQNHDYCEMFGFGEASGGLNLAAWTWREFLSL